MVFSGQPVCWTSDDGIDLFDNMDISNVQQSKVYLTFARLIPFL